MGSQRRSILGYDLGRLIPNVAKPHLWGLFAALLWVFLALGFFASIDWLYMSVIVIAALGATGNALNGWRVRYERARSRLLNNSICPRCGFDLRATTGDRCNECAYWLGVPRKGRSRTDAVDD